MWAEASNYEYKSGDIFLGYDPDEGIEIGVETPRHAITIAGARSGKGAACIIPNLIRWPDNVLVIDPKGEAAEETAKDREALGQTVRVVDPFNDCNVEDRLRATYNPLDELNLDSLVLREDILAIADGIVLRHDPKHGRWDKAAVEIIAGLIAFVKVAQPPEQQNLIRVREILTDKSLFAEVIDTMDGAEECGGLMNAAATVIELQKDNEFTENAIANTSWLDSKAMKTTLASSSFSLSELKNADISVYLVLPVNRLSQEQHGRFLRLFVRCAIDAMQKRTADGRIKNKRCLFILDEFFSLGRIDEISKSAGQMPGFGLHLWPFLQDMGQLVSLYGSNETGTFFGNADLHQFFGNTDLPTLEYMSKVSGVVSDDDIGDAPEQPIFGQSPGFINAIFSHADAPIRALGATMTATGSVVTGAVKAKQTADYNREKAAYDRKMTSRGHANYSPDQMATIVQRKDDVVADNMFCVLFGSENLLVKPAPFFRDFVLSGKKKKKKKPISTFPYQGPYKLLIEYPFVIVVLIIAYAEGTGERAKFLLDGNEQLWMWFVAKYILIFVTLEIIFNVYVALFKQNHTATRVWRDMMAYISKTLIKPIFMVLVLLAGLYILFKLMAS